MVTIIVVLIMVINYCYYRYDDYYHLYVYKGFRVQGFLGGLV